MLPLQRLSFDILQDAGFPANDFPEAALMQPSRHRVITLRGTARSCRVRYRALCGPNWRKLCRQIVARRIGGYFQWLRRCALLEEVQAELSSFSERNGAEDGTSVSAAKIVPTNLKQLQQCGTSISKWTKMRIAVIMHQAQIDFLNAQIARKGDVD